MEPRKPLDLDNIYMHHPPKADQTARYQAIREQGKKFASLITDACPESRERSLALTKIEEGSFWANAAIARNE